MLGAAAARVAKPPRKNLAMRASELLLTVASLLTSRTDPSCRGSCPRPQEKNQNPAWLALTVPGTACEHVRECEAYKITEEMLTFMSERTAELDGVYYSQFLQAK